MYNCDVSVPCKLSFITRGMVKGVRSYAEIETHGIIRDTDSFPFPIPVLVMVIVSMLTLINYILSSLDYHPSTLSQSM